MPSAPVEVRNLTKRYGSFTALDDCSFALAPGEICGLLGPNGAGKSTLLRLLMGYLRPTSGEARIDGLDCYADSVAVHARTAYLPGDARLFPHFAGRDVLRFFASLRLSLIHISSAPTAPRASTRRLWPWSGSVAT